MGFTLKLDEACFPSDKWPVILPIDCIAILLPCEAIIFISFCSQLNSPSPRFKFLPLLAHIVHFSHMT